MSADALTARELTRRVVERAVAKRNGSEADLLAAHTACEHACRHLSRSLGATGFHALLTRALAQAEVAHPLLKEIRVGRLPEPLLGGVAELVQKYGSPAVAAGFDGLLEEMFDLLGRLIGIDMVARLVEQRTPDDTQDDEGVT